MGRCWQPGYVLTLYLVSAGDLLKVPGLGLGGKELSLRDGTLFSCTGARVKTIIIVPESLGPKVPERGRQCEQRALRS